MTLKGQPQKKLTPEQKGHAIALLAQGQTNAQVATALGVSKWTIERLRKEADNAALIVRLSEQVKRTNAEALVNLSPKLHEFCEQMIQKGDAKSVDAAFRAWAASEKIRSSVSGELIPRRDMPSVGIVIQLAPYAASADALAGKSLGAGIIIGQQVEHLSPHAEAAGIFTEPSNGQ